MLRGDSVLRTILRTYGRAAEIFPASEKGWHGFPWRPRMGPGFYTPVSLLWPRVSRGVSPYPRAISRLGNS